MADTDPDLREELDEQMTLTEKALDRLRKSLHETPRPRFGFRNGKDEKHPPSGRREPHLGTSMVLVAAVTAILGAGALSCASSPCSVEPPIAAGLLRDLARVRGSK